jgi:hypothetical protein
MPTPDAPIMDNTSTSTRHSRSTNRVLAAVAVLLALNLLKPFDLVASASAQPGEGTTLASAIEQRKQMITQLTAIEKKLEKVEAALAKGIKISEMPDLKIPAELKEAIKNAKPDKADKPAESAAR